MTSVSRDYDYIIIASVFIFISKLSSAGQTNMTSVLRDYDYIIISSVFIFISKLSSAGQTNMTSVLRDYDYIIISSVFIFISKLSSAGQFRSHAYCCIFSAFLGEKRASQMSILKKRTN